VYSKLQWFNSAVLNLWRGTEGWSYNSSTYTMNWESARHWCRQHYTDMVAIQNKEEIYHLNSILPKVSGYYWIGIRKINGSWTWVGTNKTLTKEAENWADKEPNNGRNNEDCVEIYIKRGKDEGKWNDESCLKEKTALCYTEDVTSPDRASVHCSHPYGNFSYDSQCEYSCEEGYELKGSSMTRCTSTTEWSNKPPTCEQDVTSPDHASVHCSHPYGNFSYDSQCEYSCEEGYELKGSSTTRCTSTTEWSSEPPTCERDKTVIKCKPKDVTSPDHASVHCSHENFSYDSQCEYSCEEGYELKGSSTTRCTSTTEWSSKPPTCELVQCPELIKPQKGQMQCLPSMDIFSYQSTCEFMCEEGYTLRDSSSSTLFCGATGRWNHSQPTCESKTEDVTSPDHAIIHCSHPYENYSYDSQCEYSCEEGYELKGSSTTRCTSTTEWSSKPPTCELVQCQELISPQDGKMHCQHPIGRFSYQSACEFICEEGYMLQDSSSSTLFCGATGRWNHSQPTCESKTSLNLLRKTFITITSDEYFAIAPLKKTLMKTLSCTSSFKYGSKCSFSCAEGFHLQGASEISCTKAAKWSQEPPRCEGNQ
uniref:Selectin E n=1 Tax=Sinocyclocheilus grahami TaxID=75366 RepID=A0A672P698_SINGR